MNLLESLRVSIRGLANNKLRSALTMLGIIIGVGVVIMVVAIGEGATQRVTETVNSLGTNLLTIFPGQQRVKITAATTAAAKGGNSGGGGGAGITLLEAESFGQNFPKTVDAVAPTVRGDVQIRLGNKDANSNLTGADIQFPYVKSVETDRGRFFTEEEVDGSQKVCVLGTTVADKLLGNSKADMTGQTIAINRQNYKVVGMQAPKGATSWGQDQDDVVIVPITTAMRRVLNRKYVNMISVRCTTDKMMPLAQEQISAYLRNKHHIQPPYPDNDDFNIRSQTDLMQTQQSVTGTMTTLLSIVAVISLIVGGIGIMNIMLVSVTERTREIGIRKAIGANPRDILLQFLIESAILSLLGGLIGIGVGVGGASLLASVGGWSTIVNVNAVFVAVIVSVGVGLFFGIYPASKAASLPPIVALRYE